MMHPITTLRRWARRWLGVDDDFGALIAGMRTRWDAHLDHHRRCDDYLVETFGIVADRLDKLDAKVARLEGTTGAIGDRYPVALHDGRCLRRCCADLDDQAFTDAFRRVTGEGG